MVVRHHPCRCGHGYIGHRHYQAGSDCAFCSCSRYRRTPVPAIEVPSAVAFVTPRPGPTDELVVILRYTPCSEFSLRAVTSAEENFVLPICTDRAGVGRGTLAVPDGSTLSIYLDGVLLAQAGPTPFFGRTPHGLRR
jgi:hypothetical protein